MSGRGVRGSKPTVALRRVLNGLLALTLTGTGVVLVTGAVAPGTAGATVDGTNNLTSVSCTSASFCAAVDRSGNALTFNGTSWSAPALIDGPNELSSVSCPSPSFCVAVDGAGNAFTYNGSSWSAPTVVESGNILTAVSCATASFCVALDFLTGNVFTYNGTTWSAPTFVDPGSYSYALSCPTVSFCAAVGTASGNAGYVLTYNGSTWSTNPLDGTNGLAAVSCPTASFCTAVDDAGNTLTYNGSSWSSPANVDGHGLTAVSCPIASFCAAGDNAGNALTYDGSSWSTPTDIDATNGLTSVSCPSASFCAAVDDAGSAITYDTSPTTYSCNVPSYGLLTIPALVVQTPAAPTAITAPGTFTTTLAVQFTLPSALVNASLGLGVTQVSFDAETVTVTQDGGSALTAASKQTSANNLPQSVNYVANTPVPFTFVFDPMTWTSGPGTGPATFHPGEADVQISGNNGSFSESLQCFPPGPQAAAIGGPSGPVATLATTTVSAPAGTPTLQVPGTVSPELAQVSSGKGALWKVTVSNTSSVPAHGVVLRAAATSSTSLPLAFDLGAMAGSGSTCSNSGAPDAHVNCSLGTMGAGAKTTVYAIAKTGGLSSGTGVSGTVTVTSSDAPTATGSLGTVTVLVIPNTVFTVVVPGVPVVNTFAKLSVTNAVKVKLKTPKKVLPNTLPADSVALAPHVAVSPAPITKNAARAAKRAARIALAQAAAARKPKPVKPPPLSGILGSLDPSQDHLLCPQSGVGCYGQVAQLGGNFSPYNDKTHPVSVQASFFVGTFRADTALWMDKGNGTTAQLGLCTKSGKAYHTPCYTQRSTTGSAGKQVAVYSIVFVGSDPRFGLRG